jgi:hypothetical protein
MNKLLSDPPVSANDADTSHGRLIFTKFLEDQGFVELLLERSLLDGSARRVVTRASRAGCHSKRHLSQTDLYDARFRNQRAVYQFCEACVLVYAQLWEADFLVARVGTEQVMMVILENDFVIQAERRQHANAFPTSNWTARSLATLQVVSAWHRMAAHRGRPFCCLESVQAGGAIGWETRT